MDAPCFSSRFCPKTSHCHHLLAFFPSCILVPGSPGKSCTCTLQGAWKHNSSDQAAFFHCSMVQSWCSCSHCHFEWCTGFSIGTLSGLQLAYTENWLFWHLSIRTNFFGNLSYSSSPVGLDHTGAQTVFTPHVHHWARGTVGGSALFHCRPATVLPVI